MATPTSDFPYADTEAARLLRVGLQVLGERADKVSLREVGRRLGYKQPVVLSHMASGRIPVPVERATQLAAALELDERHFVHAVLEQRYPNVSWRELFGYSRISADVTELISRWAGAPVRELSEEHLRIARELLRDRYPGERWLSPHEVATISMIRSLRPEFITGGLTDEELDKVGTALGSPCADRHTPEW
jgi:hypothetical protein